MTLEALGEDVLDARHCSCGLPKMPMRKQWIAIGARRCQPLQMQGGPTVLSQMPGMSVEE